MGSKEFMMTDDFSFVVCKSKQYAILLGREASVTKIYFFEMLKDENDTEGFGSLI